MKKIGLFISKGTKKTNIVAQKIQEVFGTINVEFVPIEEAWQKEFESFDCLIVGTSTWFDGELPDYWDELIPAISTFQLKGRKVAIFGLGNQLDYPDNFVDGIGLLAETFKEADATLVGYTSTEGYNFNTSKAVSENQFAGLVLDLENQPDKTDERIRNWVKQLIVEFDLDKE
jgi:flavodoxin I